MIPFRDLDLRQVIENQWNTVNKKIDSLSNEEIMANDLDILAENIYQEFYIPPVVVYDEDFSKREIKQGKIRRAVDPFFREYHSRDYVEVDGIIATFYYPYSGEKDLFKCRASTFSLGGYPEITLERDSFSFRIEKTLTEMNQANAKDDLLKGLEHCLTEIKSGLSYANGDVSGFNSSLKGQALKKLAEKKKKVESFFAIANMFEVPIEKKEYAEKHIPLKRNIVPVAHKYEAEDYPRILEHTKIAFAQYTAESLMTNRSEIGEKIRAALSDDMTAYGINIVAISIEDVDFTDAFTDAVEAKQVAEQNKLKAQTEQAQKTMEAEAASQRQVIEAQAAAEVARINAEAAAEVAKIEADAAKYAGEKEAEMNRKLAESLTDTLVRYYYANHWDGKLPQYISNEGTLPIINFGE